MNTKPDPSAFSAEMRRKAEAKLAERQQKEAAVSAPAIDPQRLLHELQVHQIQLEIQNEELMRARAESEALLHLYTDLYDFSPVGYCVLTRYGVIQQINLTGATLLGVERSNLIQRRFGLLVAPTSRPVFSDFLEKVFADEGKASCEVALQKEGDRPLWVHIEASADEKQSCRVVMMDITDRVLAYEKLRESEERFRSLASSFNDVIYTLDTQQRHTGVYGDWVAKVGLTPEFFLGKTAAEIFGPEAAQIHAEPNRQALVGKPVVYEWSSGVLHYQTAVSPLRNLDGEIVGIVGVGRDITEGKRTEKALRESEERYHNLFEKSSTVMLVIDPETAMVVDANPVACKYYGWSHEELLKKKITDINTLTVAEVMTEMDLARTQKRSHFVLKHRLSDGTIRDVEVYTGTLVSSGRPLLFSIVHDITERRQAEQALSLSEARFRSIINVSPVPMALNDDAGRITFLNPAFIQTFGYDLIDIPTLADWWPKAYPDPDYRQWVANTWQVELIRMKQTGTAFVPLELKIRCKDGTERFALTSAASLVNSFDDNHLVLLYDITKRKQAEEALLKFKLGIERSADAIFMTDSQGEIVYINPSFEKIYGYTLADSIGHTPRILKSGNLPVEAYQQFWENLFNKNIVAGEITNRTKDGHLIAIEGSNNPILDGAGNIIGFLGIHRDITERKRVDEALRQRLTELEALHHLSNNLRMAQTSDEALPLLLDEAMTALNTDAGAVWLYDPATDELRSAAVSGWFYDLRHEKRKPGEGIVGKVFTTGEIYLSHDIGRDPQALAPHSAPLFPNWGGACVPIRAGVTTIGVLLVSVSPPLQITPEQVKLLESLAEMAGATLGRLRLWQEAQEQALRVQRIMETTPAGMLLLDDDGRILLFNPTAMRALTALTGASPDQPLTHLGKSLLAELLTPPSQGNWHEVQSAGHTFEVQARSMSDRETSKSWVLVINDVTAERERERYQQAQERLAIVGQMAAGIAHDFNNIMGVIVLYTDMLRGSPDLSDRQQRQLDTIYTQAQHAADLIRQILDFSRRSVLEKIALDILPLVKELVALLERTLPESIHLELAYDRSEYIINGDPTRLQQALMNLAVNARDAMPDGGKLTFAFSSLSLLPDQTPPVLDMTAGEWLCLTVADTGIGITPKNMTHLFEPFFTTKEPGKGTGLGLPQVYGIVKQHDGHIAVQTEEGNGTAFTIYLPVLMAARAALPATKAGLVQGQGETILVVEDNQNMRTALVDILESLNYRVQEAGNGREALAILQENLDQIALVLSDLVMPEMGGQALLQALRDRGLGLPFVVLSGHPLTNEMQVMQAQGLTDWLLKPPELLELTATLSRALGR